MSIDLIIKNQIAIMEAIKDMTENEWDKSNLKEHIENSIHSVCDHPFKQVISGDEGMFCIVCQKYISA